MRIRKRFLQSVSANTPAPSSEPHAGDDHRHPLPLVQQQEVHPNGNLSFLHDRAHPQPSDLPLNHRCHLLPASSSGHTIQIGLQPSTLVLSDAGSEPEKPVVFPPKKLVGESKREIIKINDTGRKQNTLCAEIGGVSSIRTPPTASHLVLEGWLEGDKLIPIKKRRGSFGKRANHDLEEHTEMIEGTMKLKLKQNDKCVVTKEVSATTLKKNKKNVKRGNVIMEGSRCSRVNGRGWRCCQQTLVGYSLCEHHLGKGRLRSITSVRGRAQKASLKQEETQHKEVETVVTNDHEFEDDDDDEEEFSESEEESISLEGNNTSKKKKKKIGIVKARSLRSLLSQIGS